MARRFDKGKEQQGSSESRRWRDGGSRDYAGTMCGTKSAPSWHQVEILRKSLADAEIADLNAIAEPADRTKFRNQVLKPLLVDNLLAMTAPDKLTSRNQRYRTTDKGWNLLASLKEGGV